MSSLLQAPAHLATPLSQSLVKWESENKMVCEQRLLKGEGPKTSWTRELTNDGELILVRPASPRQRGAPLPSGSLWDIPGAGVTAGLPASCWARWGRTELALSHAAPSCKRQQCPLCVEQRTCTETLAGDLPGRGGGHGMDPWVCCHPPSRCARAFWDQLPPAGPEPRSRAGRGTEQSPSAQPSSPRARAPGPAG